MTMRVWLSVSAGLFATLLSLDASAVTSGQKGGGKACTPCHAGGTPPTVKIDGPSTMKGGESVEFTFTVTTADPKASGNIAVDKGTLTAGENLKVLDGELVQAAGGVAAAGTPVAFKFTVKAPASGSITISAVGLASNGGAQTDDGAAATTKSVTVTGGAAPAGGDDDDAPASSSSSGNNSNNASSDDEDEEDTGIPNSGCAATPSKTDTTSALVALGIALVVARSAKRRRP